MGKQDALIPPAFANIWDQYLDRVEDMHCRRMSRFRQIHDGHCTYLQPAERKFVTPEAIKGTCVVGTPEEIVRQIA